MSLTPLPARIRRHHLVRVAGAAALAAVALAGCSTTPAATGAAATSSAGSSKVITVVAAENFWGSLAGQLGGTHVKVTSIISNPDADPHSYEPTAADGREVAAAQLVIINGVGYDGWATKLADARNALAARAPQAKPSWFSRLLGRN